MANASFTRDEVILALDTYYTYDWKLLTEKSDYIRELSVLLRQLPIHTGVKNKADFRPAKGILRQITLFRSGCNTGRRDPNVSKLFFDVAFQFEDNHEELHNIASAIKRNLPYFNVPYGSEFNSLGFPEGVLLGQLHSQIEHRDGKNIKIKDCCEVCGLKLKDLYNTQDQLLEFHLLEAPSKLNWNSRYKEKQFICVCPNCHAALHKMRPWRSNSDAKDILK